MIVPHEFVADLGFARIAWIVIMPDGSRQYVPIVDDSIQVPRDAADTYLVTFDGDRPIVHPSSRLLWDVVDGDYSPRL